MNLKRIILTAFAASGIAALMYEVVWIRPLQFVLGSTTYTVSIILAAFMAGLALGSFIISRYTDRIKNLPATYALLELGIGAYGVLLLTIFNKLPDVHRVIFPLNQNFYVFEFAQFVITFLVLLIPTTLMGATFPVIARFYTTYTTGKYTTDTTGKIGKGIGEVYSANNIGAIIGSFAAGFVLIPLLGIKMSMLVAAALNIGIGCLVLYHTSIHLAKKIVPLAILFFAVFAFVGEYNIKEMYSGGFYRSGYPKEYMESAEFLYYNEGLHATLSVIREQEGGTVLLFNGKGQGSSIITDLRVNFLLSYLPLLLKPESKEALVVGLGTGTTSGQLAQFLATTTVEIEPAVVNVIPYFSFMNENVLRNPNHKLVIADGRNYLLRSTEKYDVIVPEPSDPWQSFSSSLYSKEFFELSQDHLRQNGLYAQWVPLYELDINTFKSFYRTFNSVFPYIAAFASIKEDEELPVKYVTPEIILIGSHQPIKIDEEGIKKNFEALPSSAKQYLGPIGLRSSDNVLHLLLFTEEQMKGYADDAPLVTDDNPLLEFSTAKRVLYQDPKEVLSDIERFLEKSNGKR